jgi:hypothetical protein
MTILAVHMTLPNCQILYVFSVVSPAQNIIFLEEIIAIHVVCGFLFLFVIHKQQQQMDF